MLELVEVSCPALFCFNLQLIPSCFFVLYHSFRLLIPPSSELERLSFVAQIGSYNIQARQTKKQKFIIIRIQTEVKVE